MNLIVSKEAKKFIEKLGKKQARQVAIRMRQLQSDPYANDSKKLKTSYSKYYRVDAGEFRIIYEIVDQQILVLLVGKRNDNEVYNKFKRK